jgi:TP53 regulating kinase-like protein
MDLKTLGSGAEAIVYLEEDNARKSRIEKSYRIPEIDIPLRKSRTKREAKIIEKLQKIINVPKVLKITEYDIVMENIKGTQLKKLLDKRPELAEETGVMLAKMHDNNIIHGDLTTSNMIMKDDSKKEQLYFIDFGLSFVSTRIEDKAVDIHLFKQALESKHYKIYDTAYKEFLKGYNPTNLKEILERLKTVEKRGKYKEKT